MLCGVDLLHVEQDEIREGEEFLHVLVPDSAVRVHADVQPLLFQLTEERHERLGLYGRLAAREGDASALAEEGLHRDGLFEDIRSVGRLAFAHRVNRVRVGTIEAAERAALKEHHIAQSRTVEGAQGLITVNTYLHNRSVRVDKIDR